MLAAYINREERDAFKDFLENHSGTLVLRVSPRHSGITFMIPRIRILITRNEWCGLPNPPDYLSRKYGLKRRIKFEEIGQT
jgi:hypothetical protein